MLPGEIARGLRGRLRDRCCVAGRHAVDPRDAGAGAAVDQNGQLLSYADAGTPGNVSSPDVVGFGGWQVFKLVFAGRNLAGDNRIYAVPA